MRRNEQRLQKSTMTTGVSVTNNRVLKTIENSLARRETFIVSKSINVSTKINGSITPVVSIAFFSWN